MPHEYFQIWIVDWNAVQRDETRTAEHPGQGQQMDNADYHQHR
jgi:hypothetical protein